MADERNIELVPVIKVEDINKSASRLRTAIQKIFDSATGGKLNSQLMSLQTKMGDLTKKSQEVQAAFDKLPENMTKSMSNLVSQETQLKKWMDETRKTADSTYTEQYRALSKTAEQLREQILLYQEYRKQQRETGPVQEYTRRIKEDLEQYKRVLADKKELEKTGQALIPEEEREQAAQELQLLQQQYDEVISKQQELLENGGAYIEAEATEEGRKLLQQQEELNNQMRIYVERWNEVIERQEQSEARQEYREQREGISDVTRSMAGLTAATRGLSRIIPGMNASLMSGITMSIRGITRLSTLTKKDLVAALAAAKAAFMKLLSAIAAHPIIALLVVALLLIKKIVDVVKKKLEELDKAIDDLVKKTAEGLKKALQGAIKVVTAGTKQVLKLFSLAVQQSYKLLVKSYTLIGKVIKAIGTFLVSAVTKLVSKLGSLKSVISENLKLLAKFNDGLNPVNKALSDLTSSLAYVKGSLAAAFAPILTYVTPILVRFLDLLANVINMLGMLFAKITGATSFIKATRIQNDYADSIDEVGDSAKEAEQKLASYDKLEVIQQNKDSGSGGGGGGAVGWEEVPIDDDILEKFKDWLSHLYEIGNELGTKLRDFLNGIPWDKIKEWASLIGKGLASFLNGFIEVEGLGDALGRTFGEIINTIATFLHDFFDEFHFDSLGKFFGDILMNGIETIDWPLLGKTLALGLNGMFKTLRHFADRVNGFKIGTSIGEMIDAFIEDINWNEIKLAINGIAFDLAELLNGLVTPERFANIGKVLAESLNSIVGGIRKFFATWSGENFGKSLTSLITEFLGNVNWKDINRAIFEFVNDLAEVFNSLSDSLPAIGESISKGLDAIINGIFSFFNELDSKKIADNLDGFFDNLFDIDWTKVQFTVKTMLTKLMDIMNGLITPENFATVGETLGNVVMTLIGGIGTIVEEGNWDQYSASLATGIMNFFNSINWAQAGATVGDFALKLLELIENALNDPNFNWQTIADDVAAFVNGINWEDISEAVGNLSDEFEEGFDTIWKTLEESGVLDKIFDTLATVLSKADLWNKLWDKLKEQAKKTIKAKVFGKEISDGIYDGAMEGISTGASVGGAVMAKPGLSLAGGILGFFANLLGNNVEDEATAKGEGIGENISDGVLAGMTIDQNEADSRGLETINTIHASLEKAGEIHSPSKKMYDIGENLILGIFEGFNLVDFATEMQAWWDANVAPWFTAEKWQEVAQGIHDGIELKLTELHETMTQKWEEIKTTVHEKVEELKTKVNEIFEELKTKLKEKWEQIKTEAKAKVDLIKETVKNAFQNMKEDSIQKFEEMKNKIVDVFNNIKDKIKAPINGILAFIESMVNGVINGLNKMIDAVNSLHFDLPDWLPAVGGKSLGFTIPNLSNVSLPRLAQGAVIPPNKEFAAILGDQKSGVNIETPLDTMVKAFKQALSEEGGVHNPVILQLNGKVVAEAVWDEERKRYKQTGRTQFA